MCHRTGKTGKKREPAPNYDMIIVGAGTAGLSAAIYGVRAGKKVLLMDGRSYGGQIINTPEIDNYPGIKHISGFDFATELYEQAMELGTDFRNETVMHIENMPSWKRVVTNKSIYSCRSIILATGAKKRPLGLENEQRLTGSGISYCAACDGAFFKGKTVAVVGGGNTALEDARVLSAICDTVYLIHRRAEFRGEKALLTALKTCRNVIPILETTVTALNGDSHLESIEIKHLATGECRTLSVSGLFIAIGQMPENDAFADIAALDESGYIQAGEDCHTSTPGIFAAGDCRTKAIRQLTTAAADGAVAALGACEYVDIQ